MNRKIAVAATTFNAVCVAAFALSMLLGSNFFSYFSSFFIALSYVAMAAGYCLCAPAQRRLAGLCALGFACMYAAVNAVVYFTQMTAVRGGELPAQALEVLDFQNYGLFFSLDLLGYALMALSTLFAGMAVTRDARALRVMLMAHGAFFVPCVAMPILGVFSAQAAGSDRSGVVALLFWCAYFIPVGVLSGRYFSRALREGGEA